MERALLLEYQIQGEEVCFTALDELGSPVDVGKTRVKEETPCSIFGEGFGLLRDYLEKNMHPRFSLHNVANDTIILSQTGSDIGHRFIDWGSAIGFQYAGDYKREHFPEFNGVALRFTREGQVLAAEIRIAKNHKLDAQKRQREEELAAENLWYGAQRQSLSDSVIREEIKALIDRCSKYHRNSIGKTDIHECAVEIMKRENLARREILYRDGKNGNFPHSLVHSFIADELRNKGFSGVGRFYK